MTKFLITLAIIFYLGAAVRFVAPFRRLVLFRLGRYWGRKGPGVVLVWPGIDRVVQVDLRDPMAFKCVCGRAQYVEGSRAGRLRERYPEGFRNDQLWKCQGCGLEIPWEA